MTSSSSSISSNPFAATAAMDTSVDRSSKKRTAGEMLGTETIDSSEQALKKPCNETRETWARSFSKKAKGKIYTGPSNLANPGEPLQIDNMTFKREGVGRITEITDYVRKRLIFAQSQGRFLETRLPVIGKFVVTSTQTLLASVALHDKEYRALRTCFKSGIDTIINETAQLLSKPNPIAAGSIVDEETSLSAEQLQALSEFSQAFLLDSLSRELKTLEKLIGKLQDKVNRRNSNKEEMAKLQKNLGDLVRNIRDPKISKVTVLDTFHKTTFEYEKTDPELDEVAVKTIYDLYNEYLNLYGLYTKYLDTFHKAATEMSEVYKEGLQAMQNDEPLSSSSSSSSSRPPSNNG